MADDLTIWHNPRCSKSRAALALLTEAGKSPAIRLYLQEAPTEVELREVLSRLGIPAIGLVRTGEARFRELGLSRETPEAELVAAMAENPILIERPVVIRGARAVLGRPPERVMDLA